MRYQETHPWINFELNLCDTQLINFWFQLGEAQSKCVHIAQAPLLPEVARRLHTVNLAKGAIGTTAIEGNTLTEEDALKLAENKELDLPRSKEYLAQEVGNIINASNSLLSDLSNPETDKVKFQRLSVAKIRRFNQEVLNSLDLKENITPGEIRQYSVGVSHYIAPPAEDCEYLLQRLCDWLNSDDFKLSVLPGDSTIATGILKAILAHLYIAWIHPFGDGNGRTARLIELSLLLASGVPSAAAHLLSNYYNETRERYYLALEKSSRDSRGALNFIEYAVNGFVEQLESHLAIIQKEQMRLAWINFIHQSFDGKRGDAVARQKALILEFTKKGLTEIDRSQIRTISPKIEQLYRNKTDKSISRDLTALKGMKLIENFDRQKFRMTMIEHLLKMMPISNQKILFPVTKQR